MEADLLGWLADIRTPVLDSFFASITYLGSLRFLFPSALVVALVQVCRRRLREAAFLPLVLISTALLCFGLKRLSGRQRPRLFEAVIPLPEDGSWPSAHAAQSMAFVVACLVLIARPWRWALAGLLLMIAGLVGLSRLYLQVHWPSDVIAGMLLGAAWAWLTARWLSLCTWKNGVPTCGVDQSRSLR